MEKRTDIKVLLLSLSVFLVSCFIPAVVQGAPHRMNARRGSLMFEKSGCSTCHVLDSGGGIVKGRLTASVTILCGRCHEKIFSVGYMHPINIRPGNIPVPADMPLASDGALNCCTCHDVHLPFFTPYGTHTYYLRRGEVGKTFCSICHHNAKPLRAGHKGNLGRAHITSEYMVPDSSQGIDRLSQDCISCHDGSFGTSIPIRVATTAGSTSLGTDMENHPIGIDYEAARISRKRSMSDLRPMPMVDPRIHFFDGKIGCGSCHDPYSTIEKQLVMSDRRSALCFSCHLMERGF